MAIWGEIEDDGDVYAGENDEARIEITPEAWSEACHVLTMRGIDRRRWRLYEVETWLTDTTLSNLEGVEIVSLRAET